VDGGRGYGRCTGVRCRRECGGDSGDDVGGWGVVSGGEVGSDVRGMG
jgi:hypothetical protein